MADDSRLPSYHVRPGVTFPDWTAVTSSHAREALFAIFEAFGVERTWRDYTPVEDGVRATLLRLYPELGRTPTIDELAGRAGVSECTIRPILASLKARDLVVLNADGERIVGAYPWTERNTEHQVSLSERNLNALCAIDALGAGDMYRRDVEIRSRCRSCGKPVTITTRDRGRAVADIQPGSAVVWSAVRHTHGCAADTICTVVAFFCGDAHLEAWRAEHHPDAPGFACRSTRPCRSGARSSPPALQA